MTSRDPATYKVEAYHMNDRWVVEMTRRIEGVKGCRVEYRWFSSKRSAVRFARSRRRVARVFREYDREQERLTFNYGGDS